MLVCLGVIFLVQVEAGRDDRNRNNNHKSYKKPSRSDDPNDDDDPSDFQLTFIPQMDLDFKPQFKSPFKDPAKQEQIKARLESFVRDKLIDQDEVDRKMKRSRKEWEDEEVMPVRVVIEGLARLASGVLQAPGLKHILEDRDKQDKFRQNLLMLITAMQTLLADPNRMEVLHNPDRWYSMFEKLKVWEGAPKEQVLEIFLDIMDQHTSGRD